MDEEKRCLKPPRGLARVVCADTEMLTQQEIIDIAKYVYDEQIQQIVEGLVKSTYARKRYDSKGFRSGYRSW